MSLLREIQVSLMQEGTSSGPVLLKLRFLASRLGSDLLEEWVKHESEGYPKDALVPDYRKIDVTFTGNFSGPFESGLRNVPIPPALVAKFAGESWTSIKMRQSVSAVDDLVAQAGAGGGNFEIDMANLTLLLDQKVYPDYRCMSVKSEIPRSALVEVQNAVRTRILEFTIELEKSIPEAAEITVNQPAKQHTATDTETVTNITQQIFHGNVTTISSSGQGAQINLSIGEGDQEALAKALVNAGIAEPDAAELAEIVSSEGAESAQEPFGTKAKAWFLRNIRKAEDGTWKVGISVATKLLTEALKKYYGF